MNILPKKRWHVRTKQNIERVRRDEAKAAAEEKELKRRILLAEQEARTDILRKRAKGSSSEAVFPLNDHLNESSKDDTHVNFFADIEATDGYSGTINKEHEAEEKARKEKYEKDIGLLTYLGQSALENKDKDLWYLKSSSALMKSGDGKDETASSKHKSTIDPLNDMKKYLALKEKDVDKKDTSNPKKSSKSSSKTSFKVATDSKKSSVEILRAKRLQREEEERKRSQAFLESLHKKPQKETEILNDRLRQYNTQFNPHLAKSSNTFQKNTNDYAYKRHN